MKTVIPDSGAFFGVTLFGDDDNLTTSISEGNVRHVEYPEEDEEGDSETD